MASHTNLPDPFQPSSGDKPRMDFADWKIEFKLYQSTRDLYQQRQIALKRVGLPAQLTNNQQAALNRLDITEKEKIQDLFTETLDNHTLAEALTVCDGLFRDKQHPVLALTLLYKRQRKPKESLEDFLYDLRRLAKDCQLGDQEDCWIMEAFVTNCNDKELLEKILDAHPDIPTLDQVLNIAACHEKTKKDSKLVKMEAAGAYAIIDDPACISDKDQVSDDSADEAHVLFVAKKGTGGNRNYLVRQPKGKWAKKTSPDKKSSSSQSAAKPSSCSGCGGQGHKYRSKDCPAFGKKCSYCKALHHFDSECRKQKGDQSSTNALIITIGKEESDTPVNSVTDNGSRILCKISVRPHSLSKPTRNSSSAEITFWADTGAMVTTLTEETFRQHFPNEALLPTTRILKACNGNHLTVLVRFQVKASYNGGEEQLMTIYIVSNDSLSLLGLHQTGLLGMKIDTAMRTISAVSTESHSPQATKLLTELKASFPVVFSEEMGKMRNYEHNIQLKKDTIPVRAPLRPVPYVKEDRICEELDKCLGEDILECIQDSKSEWNSPVHGVNKPDGGLRITVDYSSTINPNIVPTIYNVPCPNDIFKNARKVKFLSKLDLKKAYWHIVLSEESRPLTAFLTPSHGLLQLKRLPMGMTDSGASFQHAVEQSLQGIEGVAPYFDDILIWGTSIEDHDNRIRQVFERLDRDGFRVAESKLLLSRQQISMLGQLLTVKDDGIDIISDPEWTKDFLEIKPPTTLRKLQQFMGAANYFAAHVPHFASIAEPLHKLKRKKSKFVWSDECTKAFEVIKDAIASPHVLVPYDPHCPAHLTTDASLVGLGAMLSIERDGKHRPVAFASKLMTETERRYSTPEHEALAVVWGVEKFNQYLFGHHFTLHSDQQSLGSLMISFAANATTGQHIQRWFDRLCHYNYEVKHISGKDNVVADFLSRLGEDCDPSSQPTLPDDDDEITIASLSEELRILPEELINESASDKILSRIRKYLCDGWPKHKNISDLQLCIFHSIRSELLEKNELIFRGDRLIIPESLQKKILERLHSRHPGIVRMKQLYWNMYFWPRGSTECEEFVESCESCAASGKSSQLTQVPTGEIPPPQNPWEKVAIDITGPFWTAPKRQENVVVLMDYVSKWPKYLVTGTTTSSKIISWLEDVFAVWGNPLELVSDNGPQFTSHEFSEFLAGKSIKHILTPVYCPQRNGLVERFNRVIKSGTQAISAQGGNFVKGLRKIVTNFRGTAPENGKSPALLARGWEIRTDADIRPLLLVSGGGVRDAEKGNSRHATSTGHCSREGRKTEIFRQNSKAIAVPSRGDCSAQTAKS